MAVDLVPFSAPRLSACARTSTDPLGWLYCARGLYRGAEYDLVVQAVAFCLRHEETIREAQHLLAFSLLHLGQTRTAVAAFHKSVRIGNDTDWQPLVELCLDDPESAAQFKTVGGGR